MKKYSYLVSSQILGKRFPGLRLALIVCLLAVAFFQVTGCSTTSGKEVEKTAAVTEPAAKAEKILPADQYGIEITSVRMTANNHMVDFRYRVLDAKKTETLFSKETKPYLIHEKTGKVLSVPRTAKVGPLMSTYRHQQGRIYWMFFGNQPNLVKAGDEVSVVIGDFRADHIVVQ